ncbi:hypothetical protein GCM10010505_17870 [Kitasatospora aburaviensis]
MAVAVDDTGDETGTAGATGGTLAELGTGLSGKADLGHDCTPRKTGAGVQTTKNRRDHTLRTFGGHSAAYDLCR